jgi:hypothetical protein
MNLRIALTQLGYPKRQQPAAFYAVLNGRKTKNPARLFLGVRAVPMDAWRRMAAWGLPPRVSTIVTPFPWKRGGERRHGGALPFIADSATRNGTLACRETVHPFTAKPQKKSPLP